MVSFAVLQGPIYQLLVLTEFCSVFFGAYKLWCTESGYLMSYVEIYMEISFVPGKSQGYHSILL